MAEVAPGTVRGRSGTRKNLTVDHWNAALEWRKIQVMFGNQGSHGSVGQ